ncbi:uncharacterized protein BT62DRAFT_97890 [Guyanagaster necrorhizus]|uniref:Uncharacterized protein n=1 Tax=Guyanagaster necrorhizus TaxID=856835 RepID=A0A9P7VUU0_9AGAR|nr:uncharacterized protein BT62DRAFT_97890 [Guyanagaster necrorhizus MCA 3950]KAG7447023.1 hypothetical protein BT62DRAFT_97890 [Guyanagaster necrorhizus MCA 3950]
MSNIDKHADRIYEEIHTWGVLHSKKTDKLSADIQTLKERGLYKGFALYSSCTRNPLIDRVSITDSRCPSRGYLFERELLNPSDRLHPLDNALVFTDYKADVNNSNTPKIVHVYRRFHSNEQDATTVHQNIAQVFGVCGSTDFTAVIFHGFTRHSISNYCVSFTATQLLHFYTQLFSDLEVTSVDFTIHLRRVGCTMCLRMRISVMYMSMNKVASYCQGSHFTILLASIRWI